MGKGGKLHFSKPLVDGGLLFKAFQSNAELLRDMGEYESISRAGSPSYEGLVRNAPLLEELLVLQPAAELHPQPVKAALLRLLNADSSLNATQFNGQVWINLRQERLCTILCHVRKAARDPNTLQQAALKLNGRDMMALKKVIGLVSLPLEKGLTEDLGVEREAQIETSFAQPASVASFSQQTTLYPTDGGQLGGSRTLKKVVSEVSVDSDGFPAFLRNESREEDDPCERAPKYRNLGTKTSSEQWQRAQEQRQLRMSLGYEENLGSERNMKRPAAAGHVLQVEASSSSVKTVWIKLQKTIAKSPPRSYILGSLEKGQKPKLIVEVSMKRSSKYLWIIDQIMHELKAKGLSKEGALRLREEMCSKFP